MAEKKHPDDYLFRDGQYDSVSFEMCRDMGPATAIVYSRIRGYCKMGKGLGKYGICYASEERIGLELGMHRHTVARAIKQLLTNGYIAYLGIEPEYGTKAYTWVRERDATEPIEMAEPMH